MMDSFYELNSAVDDAGGILAPNACAIWRSRYQSLLKKGDVETPPPDPAQRKNKQRGRPKRSKARNLLERLRDFEDDVLRFMVEQDVPFTNNQGERDLRMTKVQQKVSGCFPSMDGAKTFCRVRSFLLTCQRQDTSASEALTLLFNGKMPDFVIRAGARAK